MSKARSSGIEFDRFATGHYANVGYDATRGRYLLRKGVDARKDQSYFLYMLDQCQLSEVLFPIGGMTKQEVRRIAAKATLPVSQKEDSQDFYGGDYRELLNVHDRGGDIVNMEGKVLGRHRGIWNYTPGQRKSLPASNNGPLYVVRLDAQNNRVVAGTREDTNVSRFLVRNINWIAPTGTVERFQAQVKTRYTQTEI